MWLPLMWRMPSFDGVPLMESRTPLDPRPGGIDEHLRRHLGRRTRVRRAALPATTGRRASRSRRADTERRADADVGFVERCVHDVAHDQTRVVDAGVGIDEALPELGLEPGAPRRARQVDTERAGQRLAPSQVVVQKSPARSIHAGRRCGSCGSTNDSGSTRCGAWRSTTSRSTSDSCTSRNSYCSR